MKLGELLTHIISTPPHMHRSTGGLAYAYTPPDKNGQAKLMLSRKPKKTVSFGNQFQETQYPSETEVATVKKYLARAISKQSHETLKTSVKSISKNGHGCVALFWYVVESEVLL